VDGETHKNNSLAILARQHGEGSNYIVNLAMGYQQRPIVFHTVKVLSAGVTNGFNFDRFKSIKPEI